MSEEKQHLIEQIKTLQQENAELKRKTKYGLNWEDKREDLDNKDAVPMLKKNDELSLPRVDGKPENYLIEGDNYHALKVLQHTHKEKVDVIYIDPPYNTGNTDFVYNDKYVDADDGFRHSKWLSFMDKRLRLARELMAKDGVIFVSIDDNEQAQLKLMMDKIFGEDNVESFIWNKIGNGSSSEKMKVTKRFRRDHEFILVGYKNKEKINFNKIKEVRNYKQKLKNPDGDPRGDYKAGALCRSAEKSNQNSSKFYTVTSPSGKTWTRQWLVTEEEFNEMAADNRIYWGKDNNGTPASKIFGNEPSIVYPSSLILDKGSASTSSRTLVDILGSAEFSNPKPTQLIKYLLEMIPNKSATVLDFFAGSGTTGHAVMELNKEDGGNRSFILCTNNEVSPEQERNYLANNTDF